MLDTRVSETADAIRRRRKCLGCDKRFTTSETIELRLPQVVKTNGTRSGFDAEKIRSGFAKALHKRFVPTELQDEAIGRIHAAVIARGEREIASRDIGEMVMSELKKLDKVGYIRFASVYRSFSDIEEFHNVLREVGADSKSKTKRALKPKSAT